MSTPNLELGTGEHWNLAYEDFKQASSASSGAYWPISPFTLPVVFDSPILAVSTASQDAKSWWWLGCKLSQVLTASGLPFNDLPAEQISCPVNSGKLIVFPAYSGQYRLKVEIPYWLRSLTIKIWQYDGPVSDSTEDLIASETGLIRSDIQRLEAKIDALS